MQGRAEQSVQEGQKQDWAVAHLLWAQEVQGVQREDDEGLDEEDELVELPCEAETESGNKNQPEHHPL